MSDDCIACPVCDGRAFGPLFVLEAQHFVRCAGCGLVLINPRPFLATSGEVYDLQYSERYIRKAPAKLKRARQRVALLRRRHGASGRWLDVGCSAGFLLAAAREAGFEVFGTDVERGATEHAREVLGLANIHCGAVQDAALPAGGFDVISSHDVIEHVPELNPFVAELKRLLAPRGIVHIRTPDLGHWTRPRDLSRWREVKPSRHLYYFDRHTLTRLFARHALVPQARHWMWKSGLSMVFRHA